MNILGIVERMGDGGHWNGMERKWSSHNFELEGRKLTCIYTYIRYGYSKWKIQPSFFFFFVVFFLNGLWRASDGDIDGWNGRLFYIFSFSNFEYIYSYIHLDGLRIVHTTTHLKLI